MYNADVNLIIDSYDQRAVRDFVHHEIDPVLFDLCKKYEITPNPALHGKWVIFGLADKTDEEEVFLYRGTILFETTKDFEEAYEWLHDFQKNFRHDQIQIKSIAPNKDFWGS